MHDACPTSSLFREVNQRIREISNSWDEAEPVGFFCECDDVLCTAPIELTLHAYDAIRAVPEQLVVIRGHVADGAVVARDHGHVLVQQHMAEQAA